MAQHDYVINNGTGSAVRTDINNVLQAIVSNNSGSSAPSTTYAFQLFADTTTNKMKIRNAANNGYIELFQLDGTYTLEDGSASTPALAFRDDLNTGIFSSAADTFDISTGGTRAMTIDSSQRVLINTTTEGHDNGDDLTIANTTNSGITIRSGTSHAGSLFFSDDTSGNGEFMGAIVYTHSEESLKFFTNASLATGTPRLMIDSSGRVLIGTTTEGNSNADDLTIATSGDTGMTIRSGASNRGRIFFSDATSGNGEFAGFIAYSHNDNELSFGTNESTRLTVDSSGNVGIGATSPQNNLHIHQGDSGASIAQFTNTTTGSGATDGFQLGINSSEQAFFHMRESAPILFTINGSERMRIDSSGNVGIGTSSPVQQSGTGLHINNGAGQARIKLTNSITGSSANDGFDIIQETEGNGNIHLLNHENSAIKFGTADNERMRIDSSGSLRIGNTTETVSGNADELIIGTTSGDNGLTIFSGTGSTGNIYFADTSTSASGNRMGTITYDHSTNYMRFSTNGNQERMRIDINGKVGIGTTSPDGLLHIEGASTGTEAYGRFSTGSANGDQNLYIQSSSSRDHMALQVKTGAGVNDDLSLNPSGGNVGIGTTSPSAKLEIETATTSETPLTIDAAFSTTVIPIASFVMSGTERGSIKASASGTQFNTSSDYRLKENVTAITDGITRLKTLKPYRFNFKADASTTVDGFFAHEVTAVPEAITGTKDEVDADNKPIYQGIDQSKLVPLLVAAVQELIGKVEALEAA